MSKRFFIVLDVADDYDGKAEDVAIWIDHALGETREVDVEVYESFEQYWRSADRLGFPKLDFIDPLTTDVHA